MLEVGHHHRPCDQSVVREAEAIEARRLAEADLPASPQRSERLPLLALGVPGEIPGRTSGALVALVVLRRASGLRRDSELGQLAFLGRLWPRREVLAALPRGRRKGEARPGKIAISTVVHHLWPGTHFSLIPRSGLRCHGAAGAKVSLHRLPQQTRDRGRQYLVEGVMTVELVAEQVPEKAAVR